MPNDIQIFVREALGKGALRKDIEAALKKGGWPADEIVNALGAYSDVSFGIPVPKRKPYLNAREAFMYLVLFLTLYISSWSFGTLLFQFINRNYPDIVNPYAFEGTAEAIRWSTSALVIAFPVFLFVTWLLQKAIARDPDKRASKIRKWLTYITLFIAAGVIIGDLITLVFNLLGGEITTRFILKVLVVGGIAGTIFGYYLWDLRREEKES